MCSLRPSGSGGRYPVGAGKHSHLRAGALLEGSREQLVTSRSHVRAEGHRTDTFLSAPSQLLHLGVHRRGKQVSSDCVSVDTSVTRACFRQKCPLWVPSPSLVLLLGTGTIRFTKVSVVLVCCEPGIHGYGTRGTRSCLQLEV